MQLAVIAPQEYLEDFCIVEGGSVQLILSQWVQQSMTYAAFFAERAQSGLDWVILDNSAHESGEGDSLSELKSIIKLIRPQEVVLPDRLFFGDDTLDTSTEAAKPLQDEFPDIHLMGVPQGRTIGEWDDCLHGLLDLGIHTIGISKDYETWPGHLLSLVDRIPEVYGKKSIQIHLLGWPRQLAIHSAIECVRPGRVRSTDSAKPVVYGMEEIEIPKINALTHLEYKYPRRVGNPLFARMTKGQVEIAIANIFRFREAIQDSSASLKGLWARD